MAKHKQAVSGKNKRSGAKLVRPPYTKPEVYIIESLDFDDEASRKEGEIIFRSLMMSGKNPIYQYVRVGLKINTH